MTGVGTIGKFRWPCRLDGTQEFPMDLPFVEPEVHLDCRCRRNRVVFGNRLLCTATHSHCSLPQLDCGTEAPTTRQVMNIKSIAIAGFKSFGAEVTVPLRPVNLLIGANGSGKSNFLNAFALLQAFGSGRLGDVVRFPDLKQLPY